jgi:hypothetical protein
MKQQTAVDWYISKIKEARNLCYDASMEMDIGHTLEVLIKKGEQAKEMEKEQIVNTWSEATAPQHEIGLADASYVIAQIKKAEQYYNETYGGNK